MADLFRGEASAQGLELESVHAFLLSYRCMVAQVYLGKWRWHGLVALKLLKVADEQHERAFVREAELLHALSHPNIVSYLGACLEPGQVRSFCVPRLAASPSPACCTLSAQCIVHLSCAHVTPARAWCSSASCMYHTC